MTRMDRLHEARDLAQRRAAERWQERAGSREAGKALIAAAGPGAADSPERRDLYAKRARDIGFLQTNTRRGILPLGVERRMGATLDWVGLAPSEKARMAGRPVARIIDSMADHVEPQGFATGFLIAADLLITNWHVFPTRGDASGCGANFLYELVDNKIARGVSFALEPERFFISDEALDFAIVAVAPRNGGGQLLADLGQLTLIEARPKILKGQPVNIIQYPEGEPKQYAVSQNRLVDILEEQGFLQYETDTLEGSSGSPAFSELWELVALHHASIPAMRGKDILARDGSVWIPGMDDAAVHWIANEGIRVSAIIGKLATLSPANPSEAPVLASLLAASADPVAEAMAAVAGSQGGSAGNVPGGETSGRAPSVTVSAGSAGATLSAALPAALAALQGGSMTGINFNFSGPVTINILPGAAPAAAAAATRDAGAIGAEKSIRFDPDYEHRDGYDPTFLDPGGSIVVPVPGIAPARLGEIHKDADGQPMVLKYHHFELVMNASRRLQMWSAANVDYAPGRKGGSRESFGSDRWVPDPRIPARLQIFNADFYKPAGNIDRGHVVRREDNAWGDSALEIEFANSDTFHWTNCTPQHEAFNQSSPGQYNPDYRGMEGIWGGFENHLQASRKGKDTKACIIAGPILAADDPSEDFGLGRIQYPLRFFKLICVVEPYAGSKRLRVFGFIFSQQDVVERFGIERFGPGRFKRYQVPLADIETAAGLVFAPELHAADTMKGKPQQLIANIVDIMGLAEA